MRIFLPIFTIVSVLCAHARAEPMVASGGPTAAPVVATSAPGSEETNARIALAVNAPLGWLISSLGVSAYLRLGDHVALRGNLATYRNTSWGEVFAGLSGDGGTGFGGRVTDVGIGAVYYPRRVWDGLTLEAGVLLRARDIYVWPEFEPKTTTTSTELAGRLLIGWSWMIRQRAFIAFAVGFSIGREKGQETDEPDYGQMVVIRPVNRQQSEAEGYLRIGLVFGE
jgi:hypothetical protein